MTALNRIENTNICTQFLVPEPDMLYPASTQDASKVSASIPHTAGGGYLWRATVWVVAMSIMRSMDDTTSVCAAGQSACLLAATPRLQISLRRAGDCSSSLLHASTASQSAIFC